MITWLFLYDLWGNFNNWSCMRVSGFTVCVCACRDRGKERVWIYISCVVRRVRVCLCLSVCVSRVSRDMCGSVWTYRRPGEWNLSLLRWLCTCSNKNKIGTHTHTPPVTKKGRFYTRIYTVCVKVRLLSHQCVCGLCFCFCTSFDTMF